MHAALTGKLHLSQIEATGIAAAVSVGIVAHGYCPFVSIIPGLCPMKADDSVKLIHSGDSGAYNKDGTLNVANRDNILSYAQPGKDFLSEIDIDRFLADYAQRGDGSHNPASSGEFKLLLRL